MAFLATEFDRPDSALLLMKLFEAFAIAEPSQLVYSIDHTSLQVADAVDLI